MALSDCSFFCGEFSDCAGSVRYVEDICRQHVSLITFNTGMAIDYVCDFHASRFSSTRQNYCSDPFKLHKSNNSTKRFRDSKVTLEMRNAFCEKFADNSLL